MDYLELNFLIKWCFSSTSTTLLAWVDAEIFSWYGRDGFWNQGRETLEILLLFIRGQKVSKFLKTGRNIWNFSKRFHPLKSNLNKTSCWLESLEFMKVLTSLTKHKHKSYVYLQQASFPLSLDSVRHLTTSTGDHRHRFRNKVAGVRDLFYETNNTYQTISTEHLIEDFFLHRGLLSLRAYLQLAMTKLLLSSPLSLCHGICRSVREK